MDYVMMAGLFLVGIALGTAATSAHYSQRLHRLQEQVGRLLKMVNDPRPTHKVEVSTDNIYVAGEVVGVLEALEKAIK
jgi:hypothetical protein